MNFLQKIWEHAAKFPELGITLRGDSVAARYSCFWIKEWKIMLDAGLKAPFNPEHIRVPRNDTVEELAFLLRCASDPIHGQLSELFPKLLCEPGLSRELAAVMPGRSILRDLVLEFGE